MPRITSPFRRHSDSWFVNTIIGKSDNLPGRTLPTPNGRVQDVSRCGGSSDPVELSTTPSYSGGKEQSHAPKTDTPFHSSASPSSFPRLLRLLLWKNYKLLVRNRFSTVAELVLPLLFTFLIVAIRFFGAETKQFDNATIFEPFQPSVIPGTIQTCCNQIYYTPDAPVIKRLMEAVQRNHFNQHGLQYSFIGFDTEEALLRAYSNSSSGMFAETDDGELSSTVLAGVVFTSEMERNGTEFPYEIEYSLRFPAALRSQSGLLGERFTFGMKQAWFTEILYPIIQPFGPRAKDQPTGGDPGYWSEGFLYLQQAIDKELLNSLTSPQNTLSMYLQRFPYPAYLEDEFFVVLQPFLPLVLILSFIYTVTSISKTLVTEKERRIHESMKMMGLTNALHWTAWFITFLALFSLSILMITVLLKLRFSLNASTPSGLAVLPKSDPTLIYFCLLIHGFQLISFCFFISSIFKTANAAAITSSVVWFMLFLPFPFLQPRYSILSSKVKILWSLLSNMGICFCCQVFCMFEGTSEGAQWSTLFQGVTPDDTFCIGDCVLVMFLNGLVYFFGAMYVSVVWPGEFGVGREWYFFLQRDFWFEGKSPSADQDSLGNSTTEDGKLCEFFERSPKSLVPGIQARHLRKSFGEVTALNRLNMTMYQNETFCLLGKNGAGKSTLVSILTGLYPPSGGTIFVNRQDIRSELKQIRKSLGVCPQHNVLFDELSVEEHLIFFASLKGMKGKLMREEVDRMIMAIGLCHKRKAEVRTLSGGMKRRLCVGIAFCGGSEVVILDEPSSGLDVEARRAIWDLIELEKVGRTVLLTTHFMEEAELLADRIAVIVSGDVRCCGSPLFLNKKYNGGYNLTIVTEEEGPSSLATMTEFVRRYLPEAGLVRSAGKELTYSLPEYKSNEFYVLFDAIEKGQKDLGIETYGARLTSMEDIFIRVNASAEEETESQSHPSPKNKNTEITFLNGSRLDPDFLALPHQETQRNKSESLLLQQFYAMVVKKLHYVWRRRGLLIGQTLIPMAYLSLVLVVLHTIPGIFDPPPHRFELDHYELFGRTVTPMECLPSSNCSSYTKYFETIHKVKEVLPSNQSFIDHILQKEAANIPAFNAKYIIGFEEKSNETGGIATAFFNNQPLHTPPLALNTLTNALLLRGRANHTVHATNHPFPYTNLDTQDTGTYWTVGFHVGYNTAFALTFVIAVFATFLVKEDVSGAAQLQRVSGLNPAVYWISNFIVDFGTYLLPCIGLLIIFAVFAGSTNFLSWSLQGYLLLLFLAFGWAVIPLVYVMSQWFSIPAVGFAGCGVACAFSGFLTILTITVLELPQINQAELALVLHRIFLIFPTYALGRGITQMSINRKLVEKCAGFNLEFLCDAAPDSYCCVKLQQNYLAWEELGIGKNCTYMLSVGTLLMLIIALMESGIFGRLKSSLVNLRHKAASSVRKPVKESLHSGGELDENVRQERERVGHCDLNSLRDSDALLIRDLTKSYGEVVAVEGISFGVQVGQCFGLLGTNGAGKTSTFKMLVGEIGSDSGDAFICSHSISKNRRKTHKMIGYCPQFDALLGELTGRETLTMFARLRGVMEKEIGGIVESLAKELVFEQYLDRLVDGYSGGNKRKLSTAVALIGTPKVVFLDEPTAGMDPVARRHVWSAINRRVREKQACVLLTSHSLEECEILCTRIAIMKNGRMQCLGSPQQLKHKYGDGFSIVIQIKGSHLGSGGGSKDPLQRKLSNLSQTSFVSTVSSVDTSHSMQVIDNYLRSHFPPTSQCILTSSHANYLHYHIKQSERIKDEAFVGDNGAEEVSSSVLFKTMENLKEQAGITAYSISQISLEQVFLSV